MAAAASTHDVSSADELEFECDSSEFEEEDQVENNVGLLPYQFEPEFSGSEAEECHETPEIAEDESRLSSLHWCRCGHCQAMGTVKECLCCTEIPEMTALMENLDINCITEHPGFRSVCLDVYVLQTCYAWYNQQYGRTINDENNRYRYTAYRMLARFAWGWLGRDMRVTLPACAVAKIRQEFPSQDGQYTGYLEPEI